MSKRRLIQAWFLTKVTVLVPYKFSTSRRPSMNPEVSGDRGKLTHQNNVMAQIAVGYRVGKASPIITWPVWAQNRPSFRSLQCNIFLWWWTTVWHVSHCSISHAQSIKGHLRDDYLAFPSSFYWDLSLSAFTNQKHPKGRTGKRVWDRYLDVW